MTQNDARAGWGHGGPGSEAPEGAPLHDLVVSIINFRTPEMSIACVDSVLAALDGPEGRVDGHVALVDNFSNDGSVEKLRAYVESLGPDAPVTLVESPANTGFSGGHNIGIRAARGRFYLVFNSDATLHPGAPQALLARAAAEPDLGILGTRLEHEDGGIQLSCFRFPSAWSEFERAAQLSLVSRLLRRKLVRLSERPAPSEIEWVSFASVLLRAEMIASIGMMDEGFFMYSEDVEYCFRARRAGWRVAQEPAARAIHYRGGSSEVKSTIQTRKRTPAYFYASRSRILAILRGRAGLIVANLAWHLGRGALAAKLLIQRRKLDTGALHEASDLWINAFDPFGDRRHPEGPGR